MLEAVALAYKMDVSIKRDFGMLKIFIDGKAYAPLSFKSFRPNPRNVSEFYAAGVRLFSVLSSGVINALGVPYSLFGESWIGEDEYDFSVIDKLFDKIIKVCTNRSLHTRKMRTRFATTQNSSSFHRNANKEVRTFAKKTKMLLLCK